MKSPKVRFANFVEALRYQAETVPQHLALTYLENGEVEAGSLTFQGLDRQAKIIAVQLLRHCRPGDRVLMLYPSGIEFLAAFFGCLYAGLVAIPVFPPGSNRNRQRLGIIAADAGAKIALTSRDILEDLKRRYAHVNEIVGIPILATDGQPFEQADDWRPPQISGDDLAYLQYTSGSTGNPKGVMVSHHNLVVNVTYMERAWAHTPESVMISWVPIFHDLGLIYGVLLPVYQGIATYQMAPMDFAQKPYRWLRAITRYRGTHNAAPNFAYELCLRKIPLEQREKLDLSCWRVSMNAAEPVRAGTMRRFSEAFAPYGFRPEVFCPSWGLAEATLIVTGSVIGAAPAFPIIKADALEENRVVWAEDEDEEAEGVATLAACGPANEDADVIIVDPETLVPTPPGCVGEIWVRGETVAKGYWQRPLETKETFGAYLADSGEGPFLRTGDTGFFYKEELIIGGRIKDLVIIRGLNHYPQDIEHSADRAHPGLRHGCGAAFSLDVDEEEKLVIVQELRPEAMADLKPEEVFAAMRRAVAEEHDIHLSAITLIPPGTVDKTSSGKIQRRATKLAFLEKRLKVVAACSDFEETPQDARVEKVPISGEESRQHQQLEKTVAAMVSAALKVAAGDLAPHIPFAQYGMDSAMAVGLSGDLAEALGRTLPQTLLYDYPNLNALCDYLRDPLRPGVAAVMKTTSGNGFLDEPVAVVGLACRFPGADGPDAFWRLLHRGGDAVGPLSANRVSDGASVTRGGFLERVDLFDAEFFGISPREAERMDPQQRLLLEVAYEALGHAGIAPDGLARSRTGVFVGISGRDYERLQVRDHAPVNAYSETGSALSIAANRLSYLWDLRGPSLSLDTACSSSLAAVHQACLSLKTGECERALAGGVSLLLDPQVTNNLARAQMLSPQGRCKTFDAAADGYVRGEGCGMVVLRLLSAAREDQDPILALIRGTAINQDGRSMGLTAPNGPAQEAVIRQALQAAGVDPSEIGYFEAHGTGTALGDPIEFNALHNVLSWGRPAAQPCAVGSVKTNIGHLEAAAGIAGLIKVVLTLGHGEIPANLNFQSWNPGIDPGPSFFVPTQTMPWPEGYDRRFACVSSFGFGGVNAHAVLEAGPAVSCGKNMDGKEEAPPYLLPLSAHEGAPLRQLASAYFRFLEDRPGTDMKAICHTAAVGRNHYPHRLAIVASDHQGVCTALQAFMEEQPHPGIHQGFRQSNQPVRTAFLFSGQGAQYAAMAKDFFETQAIFRETIHECDVHLRAWGDEPVSEFLYAEPGNGIRHTAKAQIGIFAVEMALVRMLASWNIVPEMVIGHSVGEYAAACAAGVFSLEHGLRLVRERARLMSRLPSGGVMATVFAAEVQIKPFLGDDLALAAHNGPGNTVISGSREDVARVVSELRERGTKARYLKVSHAFHSAQMDPILDEFEKLASELPHSPPRVPLISNLTGEIMTRTPDGAYWRGHLRSTVRFAEGVDRLAASDCDLCLEIGPGRGLSALVAGAHDLPCFPLLKQGGDDRENLHRTLAGLYARGLNPDWAAWYRPFAGRVSGLPRQPYLRERHWYQADGQAPKQSFPLVLDWAEVRKQPRRHDQILRLIDRYGRGVGSVGQLTGKDFLFFAAGGEALFCFNRRGTTLVALDYTGPEVLFAASVRELAEFAASHHLEVNLLEESASRIDFLAKAEFTTTPVGVWQDIALSQFKLEGNRMRRLRYLVNRFSSIEAKLSEYMPGTETALDRAIFHLMETWAAGKGTVGPLVARLKNDIQNGAFNLRTRTFIIQSKQSLQGVVMITPSPGLDGYLLDMEFYPPGSAPGCMEFGLVELIAKLKAEGCATLSLGVTLGAALEEHPHQDPAVAAFFRQIKDQNILNGEPNLQFKNKFRPTTRSLFLCRPKGLGASNLGDFLLMLGDPTNATNPDPLEGLHRAGPTPRTVPLAEIHPLVRHRLDMDGPRNIFQSELDEAILKTLAGHRILDRPLMPAAAFLEMALVAGKQMRSAVALTQFEIVEALPLSPPLTLQIHGMDQGAAPFEIFAKRRDGKVWTPHASGYWQRLPERPNATDLTAIQARLPQRLAGRDFYRDISPKGYAYGGAFRTIDALHLGDGEVLAQVRVVETTDHRTASAFLDGCLQAGLGLLSGWECGSLFLPVAAGSFSQWQAAPNHGWVHVSSRSDPGETKAVLDYRILDEEGQVIAACEEVVFKKLPKSLFQTKVAGGRPSFYRLAWRSCETLERASRFDSPCIIFPDANGVGSALTRILEENHVPFEVISSDPATQTEAFVHELGQATRRLEGRNHQSLHFLVLWNMAAPTDYDLAEWRDRERMVKGMLSIIRFLADTPRESRLWLFTRDVHCEGAGAPAHAPLWGLGQVLAREHESFWGGLADLDETAPEQAASLILQELENRDGDSFVSYAGGGRRTARVVPVEPRVADVFSCRRDGVYLITGGLGALGLQLARRLAEKGANCLYLVSRNEPNADQNAVVAAIEELGSKVNLIRADVSREEALVEVAASLSAGPPLRGVFHAAGILDDGILLNQDWSRFHRVLAPKVLGAWHLHRLTRDMDLDWFVMFSSITAWLGTPGQANYAAGNAYLDALAHYRQHLGLPALSINWGPWASSGMAASMDSSSQIRFGELGIDEMQPQAALDALEKLLVQDELHQVSVMTLDPNRLAKSPLAREPLFSELVGQQDPMLSQNEFDRASFAELVGEERQQRMDAYLKHRVAAALQIDVNVLSMDKPLNQLGLDSLMVMELRNRIKADLLVDMPTVAFFDYPSVHQLAHMVMERLEASPQADVSPLNPINESEALKVAEVDDLSDEEVDAMLARMLTEREHT